MRWGCRSVSKGFTLLTTVLVMFTLLSLAGGIIVMVTNQNRSQTGQSSYEKAQSIAWHGFNSYQRVLSSDGNWSDQTSPVTGNYGGGSYELSLTNRSTNSLIVQSEGRFGAGYFTFTKTLNRVANAASQVRVDLSGITYQDGEETIAGIEIENIGAQGVTWSASIVSWADSASLRTEGVLIDQATFWAQTGYTPLGAQSSGAILNPSSPVVLTPSQTHSLRLQFNASVYRETVVLYLNFSDGSSKEIVLPAQVSGDAGFLEFDMSAVKIYQTAHSQQKYFFQMSVTNTHPSQTIVLSTVTPSWAYTLPTQRFNGIWLGYMVAFYQSSPGVTSGTTVSLQSSSASLGPGQTKNLILGFLTPEIDFRDYDFLFTVLSDGSQINVDLDRSFDMATQLSYVSGSFEKSGSQIEFDLQNLHPTGAIYLDDIRVDVVPDLGQVVDQITYGGSEIFGLADEPDDLGLFVDVDTTTMNNSATQMIIDLSSIPTPVTVDVTFRMVDGTTTQSRFLSNPIQSDSVGIATESVYITHQTTPKNLFNVYLSNTGASPITFVGLTPSWTPNGSESFRELRMQTTRVFSNATVTNGQYKPFTTTYELAPGQSARQRLYSRNNNITSKEFSLLYHLSDGSTKQVDLFLNPKNTNRWVAGDNFEDGKTFSGGGGFTQAWDGNGRSANSLIISSNAAYSGRYFLRLRKKESASRRLSVTGLNTLKMTYRYRLRRINNSERADVKISLNGSSWTTIHSYTNLNFNGYRSQTLDLTPHLQPSATHFFIKFELEGSKNEDQWFIDELYLEGA